MDGQWNGNWAAFCALSFVVAFVAVAFVRVGWMGFIERLLVCLSCNHTLAVVLRG
jgi:hypothetical protein